MKRYWAVGPDRPATASTGIGANRAASAFSGYNGKALYWETRGHGQRRLGAGGRTVPGTCLDSVELLDMPHAARALSPLLLGPARAVEGVRCLHRLRPVNTS